MIAGNPIDIRVSEAKQTANPIDIRHEAIQTQ
jgi:hypothetical protein